MARDQRRQERAGAGELAAWREAGENAADDRAGQERPVLAFEVDAQHVRQDRVVLATVRNTTGAATETNSTPPNHVASASQ